MFLPLSIVIVKVGSDPADTYRVNQIQERLLRLRVNKIVPHLGVKIYCYTDDPTGLDTQFGLEIIPLTLRDNITDPEFYKLDLMGADVPHEDFQKVDRNEGQIVILDINAVPLTGCQKYFIDRVPLPGSLEEDGVSLPLTDEQTLLVKNNKLPFLKTAHQWWENNKVSTAFLAFNNTDPISLLNTFNENPELHQQNSLSDFIDAQESVMKIYMTPGLLSYWKLNDIEYNEKTGTALWDEHIRPLFPNSFLGATHDDPDDKFCYADHEWKTLNRHCKILLTEPGDLREDLYLRLWAV